MRADGRSDLQITPLFETIEDLRNSAAVINAVCDALSPFGIRHVEMPAKPDRIWKLIQEARS